MLKFWAVLICLSLVGCAPQQKVGYWESLQIEPQRRFDSIKLGSTQADVEKVYGPPTAWVLYYDKGQGSKIATFRGDRLMGATNYDYTAPKWPAQPVEKGMSRSSFEALVGPPVEACMGSYYIEGYTHYFCFVQGRLKSKERGVPPPA